MSCYQNQPGPAIEAFQRARRLSPFDPFGWAFSAGVLLLKPLDRRVVVRAVAAHAGDHGVGTGDNSWTCARHLKVPNQPFADSLVVAAQPVPVPVATALEQLLVQRAVKLAARGTGTKCEVTLDRRRNLGAQSAQREHGHDTRYYKQPDDRLILSPPPSAALAATYGQSAAAGSIARPACVALTVSIWPTASQSNSIRIAARCS